MTAHAGERPVAESLEEEELFTAGTTKPLEMEPGERKGSHPNEAKDQAHPIGRMQKGKRNH
ncbi:hypothetical protein [Lysobacter solisilvae (ex Woo and Kim 2020)]|uniref:Uncharacterized protein n=1 Tax=Agrilutibacter terrestris TaxID=2865112 RepID=A0A7H0FVW5_9GAMM|nr:hypothetical protein [Lysobacter terrestris]QNP40181.1 hypothetical protein H8B22_11880 [Lysobacter terrestris]